VRAPGPQLDAERVPELQAQRAAELPAEQPVPPAVPAEEQRVLEQRAQARALVLEQQAQEQRAQARALVLEQRAQARALVLEQRELEQRVQARALVLEQQGLVQRALVRQGLVRVPPAAPPRVRAVLQPQASVLALQARRGAQLRAPLAEPQTAWQEGERQRIRSHPRMEPGSTPRQAQLKPAQCALRTTPRNCYHVID